MNCFKIFSIAFAASLLFASCGDKKTIEEPKPDNGAYIGSFSVAPGTSSAFTLDNVEVKFTVAEDGKTADIEMLQVKFAERMPVTMDITVPGVTLTAGTGEYTLSCAKDGITPTIGGTEFPERQITDIEGSIVLEQPSSSSTKPNLSFSFVCMDLPVTFTGTCKAE
jgi:hypothetical protein